MKNLILILATLLGTQSLYAVDGLQTCQDKKLYLRDICKAQKLQGAITHFSQCANGFSYEISTDGIENNSNFITSDNIQCKMVEVRNTNGIESRTSYFDQSNQKVVVYMHQNGLANAYVYGRTGYYHITQFASGDSIFNFHSF